MGLEMKIFYWLGLSLALILLPASSMADSRSDVAEHYENALTAFDAKEYKSTIIHIKNALQIDSRHLASRILYGKTYVELRNGAGAEKELNLARQMGADENLTAVPLARALNLQRKYKEITAQFADKPLPAFVKVSLNYELGQAHLMLGEIDKAEYVFEEILYLSPDNPLGLQGRALVLMAQGKLDDAEAVAIKANQLAADKSQPTYLLAMLATARGNNNEATQFYDEVLRLNPEHYSARMDRAYAHIQNRNNPKAISDLQNLIERAPYDAKSHYLLGVALRNNGDIKQANSSFRNAEDAIAEYKTAIKNGHSPTLLLAGGIALANKKLLSALGYFKGYLRTNPNNLNIRKTVAKTLIQIGEAHKAIESLKSIYTESLQDAELYMIRGEAYTQLKLYKKAVDAFEKALRIDPYQPALMENLGRAQMLSGNSSAGYQNLERVLAQQPNDRKLGIFLAMQYLREGKLKEAKKVTSGLLERDTNNLSALSLHASILASLGDLPGARKHFEKVLAFKPDFRSAKLNLLKIDLMEGKETRARNTITELLSQSPEDPILLYEQVKLEQATGQVDLAIRLLEKLRLKGPKVLVTNLHLIDLYMSTGQANSAVENANKLLTFHPDNLRIMEALGKANLLANDRKRARIMFKRIGARAGGDIKQLFRVALMQVRADDLDQARFTLSKTIDIQPNFYTAIATLAELQIQTGRLEKAAALIARLKALAPDNPMSSLLEGSLATKTGNKEAALAAYTKAHKGFNSAQTAIKLFKSLLSVGKTEQAIKSLSDWSNAHPRRDDIKMILADIHFQMGEIKQATGYYEFIVSQGKAPGPVYSKLALIYAEHRKDDSLAYAKKAYELSPQAADVIDTYGWLLTKNGQPKQGLSLLRDAVSRDSVSPEIHYHIGVSLEALGETKKAAVAYKTALSLSKNFKHSKDTEKRLLRLKGVQ